MPFDRLDSDGGEIEGTGLGLALSKRLVEVMGGVIGIDSVLEKGSTFWVDLPLAESPLTTRKPMQTLEAPTATAIKTSSVLCIEDNPSNLQLIENIFQRQPNIKLLTALQGRLGITLAREHHPDVVLLDLHLPDIHGSEVVDELQNDESTRDIPVIILSADATPSQIERLKKQGIREYLTKPLNVRQFLDAVAKALNQEKR